MFGGFSVSSISLSKVFVGTTEVTMPNVTLIPSTFFEYYHSSCIEYNCVCAECESEGGYILIESLLLGKHSEGAMIRYKIILGRLGGTNI